MVNFNLERMMSRTILAEYDAEHNTLKLPERPAGVEDHETVEVDIRKRRIEKEERPWMSLRGCLPHETAEEIRRVLREAAAPDPDEA